MKFRYLGFLVALVLVTQAIVAQDDVDIDSLIKEVSTNSQRDAFSNYSYQMQFVRERKGLFGKEKLVKRFNVVLPSELPKGKTYQHRLLLVYDSRKKITRSDINISRKRIIKDLEEFESREQPDETQKAIKNKTGGYLTLRADTEKGKRQSVEVNLLKLIKGTEFSNYKELKVNGRKTISIDFRPKTENTFVEDSFYMGKIEGIILIDEKDKRIIEVESFPLGKLDEYRQQKKSERKDLRVFHYLQTRVREGFWFPKLVSLNFMRFSEQFDGLNVKIDFSFSKYNRFEVNVNRYNVRSARPKTKRRKKPNR